MPSSTLASFINLSNKNLSLNLKISAPLSPGTKNKFSFIFITISLNSHSPRITFSRFCSARTFSITSRFASPMSASNSATLYPFRARIFARFALSVLLPTPPLPLVTATVCVPLCGLVVLLIKSLNLLA